LGLPDDDLGNLLEAIVEANPSVFKIGELLDF
jgi:hypothetical protein